MQTRDLGLRGNVCGNGTGMDSDGIPHDYEVVVVRISY